MQLTSKIIKMFKMTDRSLTPGILKFLNNFPVAAIIDSRQVGLTTLASLSSSKFRKSQPVWI
jgi:hypothetical protein